MYDPFARGPYDIATTTVHAEDGARHRIFPCDLWTPSVDGPWPLVVYSHHSGGNRRAATYLYSHLSSHGYLVAALDHSETVAPELARREDETAEQRAARADAWIASRVPDVRFLLDYLLASERRIDARRIAVVGHSFGGWTALAAVEVDPRIRAVVALAPGGATRRKPGILPLTLNFRWNRDVPTLYLVAENDASLPLDGMYELFERTPAGKRMFILRRADHLHFVDDVERQHEVVRTVPFTGDFARIQAEMRPIAELCSGEQAHTFIRGLTLSHLDAVLRERDDARVWLSGDVAGELARLGIDAVEHQTR